MVGWGQILAYQERYRDLLREAERERSARVATCGRRLQFHSGRRMLAWLGRLLITWGRSLQGELQSEPLSPANL